MSSIVVSRKIPANHHVNLFLILISGQTTVIEEECATIPEPETLESMANSEQHQVIAETRSTTLDHVNVDGQDSPHGKESEEAFEQCANTDITDHVTNCAESSENCSQLATDSTIKVSTASKEESRGPISSPHQPKAIRRRSVAVLTPSECTPPKKSRIRTSKRRKTTDEWTSVLSEPSTSGVRLKKIKGAADETIKSSVDAASEEELKTIIESLADYSCGKKESLPESVRELYGDDFLTLKEKSTDYAKIEDYVDDVEAIDQKYVDQYEQNPTDTNKQLKALAKKALIDTNNDVRTAKTCIDCVINYYKGDNDYFVSLCRQPHALVWAQMPGYAHWPAKVIRTNRSAKGIQTAEVEFFHTHDVSTVSFKNCVQLTKEYLWPSELDDPELVNAILELKKHVAEVVNAYGASKMVYTEGKRPYNGQLYIPNSPVAKPAV